METAQTFGSAEGTNTKSSIGQSTTGVVGEAVSRVSQAAGEVIEQAKSKGGSIATAAAGTAKDILGQRIAAGGEWVGYLAESTKCAADNLQDKSPEIAGLVRQAGESIETLSSELRSRSVDELAQTASDFARRRPEVVFGVSALLAFVAYRVFAGAATNTARQA